MEAGFYIHIPFCDVLCPYCDFAKKRAGASQKQLFIKAVKKEMEYFRNGEENNYEFRSLYLGGGTPTTLPPDALSELVAFCSQTLHFNEPCEITVEANPEHITDSLLHLLSLAGVNRISLGAQSLHDRELAFLGRTHTGKQVRSSFEKIIQNGFSLNVDLMFGFPGQTLFTWENTLEAVLCYRPHHVSIYGLTFEERTPFTAYLNKGRINPLPENEICKMFELSCKMLSGAGYVHYEISNYALPGMQSCHNLGYWMNNPYAGFGPGAWSYLRGKRRGNMPGVYRYMEKVFREESPVWYEEELTGEKKAREALMLNLRLCEGVHETAFFKKYGIYPSALFGTELERLKEAGFIAATGETFRLTEKGQLISDYIFRKSV